MSPGTGRGRCWTHGDDYEIACFACRDAFAWSQSDHYRALFQAAATERDDLLHALEAVLYAIECHGEDVHGIEEIVRAAIRKAQA